MIVFKKAFSLVELMVVVAIIAFLASIAIPRYTKTKAKAKQAEVHAMLSSLHTAEQLFWAENGTYSTKLSGPDSIGWEPEGYNGGGKNASFNYTYGFFFPGAQEGVHYFTGKLCTKPNLNSRCFADKEKFVARATGEVFKKDTADIWSIDTGKQIKQEQNGID